MEGAAVAGQIAKKSERKGGSQGKDRKSEKVITAWKSRGCEKLKCTKGQY